MNHLKLCVLLSFMEQLKNTGFLEMNRKKVCTLLSFMEQLQNTGPLMSSRACLPCPRISLVQNKHAKLIHMIHDLKVYTCSDTNLGKFLFH